MEVTDSFLKLSDTKSLPQGIFLTHQTQRLNKTNSFEIMRRLMIVMPDNLKTQEMWNEAVEEDPSLLAFVPYHYKTQEICNEALAQNPYLHAETYP